MRVPSRATRGCSCSLRPTGDLTAGAFGAARYAKCGFVTRWIRRPLGTRGRARVPLRGPLTAAAVVVRGGGRTSSGRAARTARDPAPGARPPARSGRACRCVRGRAAQPACRAAARAAARTSMGRRRLVVRSICERDEVLHVAATVPRVERRGWSHRQHGVPGHAGRTPGVGDAGANGAPAQGLGTQPELVLGGRQPLPRGQAIEPVPGIARRRRRGWLGRVSGA